MVKMKFKTCNNHFCQIYYKHLCKGNFRSCLLMLYNSYDELDLTLFSRLFGNLVENTPIIDYVPAFDVELKNIYHCLLSRYIHLNKLPF